ncbi:hypothetical protein [Synechococcus elongatus]|uniref:Uncharacterized protein n=1 Tax=Synechococcus elongatus PCC 11802 TaxID=2283154 RepID=A0AAU6R685_SYNEL
MGQMPDCVALRSAIAGLTLAGRTVDVTMGAVMSRSSMSEMPDAAWMDWIAGGLAIVVFVGGLVMMFTGILTSKNR